MKELDKYPLLEKIIDHACDMEIPRESSTGAGISLMEKWTAEGANEYKERQYEILLGLVDKARSSL